MGTDRVPLPWMCIWATDDQSPIFHPATPWIEASDVLYARVAWEIAEIGTNMEVNPSYQVAATEDNPGNIANLGSAATSKDVRYPNDWTDALGNASAPTKSAMLIRFGWSAKKSSGNAGLGMATVGGVVEYQVR